MSDSATPWTTANQTPPSMGFSRQECWSGLPFPSPGDLPDSGIEPGSPTLQADALPSEPPGKPKVYMTKQKTQNSQNNIKRKNEFGKLGLDQFKASYKATIIKIV